MVLLRTMAQVKFSIVVEGPYLLWLKNRGPIQLKRSVCFSVCTMTEGHYAVTEGHYAITTGHYSIHIGHYIGHCWGSGGAVSPPAASGQTPGSSENILFYSTGKGLKTGLKTLSYNGEFLPVL